MFHPERWSPQHTAGTSFDGKDSTLQCHFAPLEVDYRKSKSRGVVFNKRDEALPAQAPTTGAGSTKMFEVAA